jgi:uncharacterized membrane protein
MGVWLTRGENNIFTQIGFFVLVGLASKNAILIVEFARALEDRGETPQQAAIEAARLRLRPILMTSIAFVMGVVPLFGVFLTPVFYVVTRNQALKRRAPAVAGGAAQPTTMFDRHPPD